MKKFIAVAICAVMLAALAVSVAAYTPGPDGWKAYGDVNIDYNPDLADTIIFNGDFSDWAGLQGVEKNVIDYYNLDSWLGSATADSFGSRVPEDFAINTYFAADSNYLYVAFDILDDTKVSVNETEVAGSYGGFDAFQIQLDFAGAFAAAESYERGIFYSFARRDDGEFALTIQESRVNDCTIWASDSYNEATGRPDVQGKVAETEGGWGAEFALSWQMLYKHAYDKLVEANDEEGLAIINGIEMGEGSQFNLTAGVFYLNYTPTLNDDGTPKNNAAGTGIAGELYCAAGTCSEFGELSQTGGNAGFYPDNSGINLIISGATLDIQTEAPTDEEPTEKTEEPTKEKPTEEKTSEESTEPSSEENTTSDKTETAQGCKGAIGIGVVAVAIAAVGAIALRKKED